MDDSVWYLRKSSDGSQFGPLPFKQLKQSFTRQHAAGMGNILNNSASGAAKKANMPFLGGKPVTSHNQTFGADASKNFVPRRTGG